MRNEPMVTISREVRFGLHAQATPPTRTENGFAGSPALAGLAPFVTLTVRVAGAIQPDTGMLVNIKLLDTLVRDTAVEMIRAHPAGAAVDGLMPGLFERLMAGVTFKDAELLNIELALSPYLRYIVEQKEPAMVQMTERFEFSAAHRLHSEALSAEENRAVFGRCNNPNGHGHNYEFEVTVAGVPDGKTGTVILVPVLQEIVTRRVIDLFDHKHLNMDCAEFQGLNPTVENIAMVIHGKLAGAIPGPGVLRHVKVWETPKTWAQYPA